MKYFPKLLICCTVILVILFSGMSSCSKEQVIQNNITDTVYVNTEVAITAALISANKWMIEEARGVRAANNFYYLRGGSSNTQSFDNEYIKFETNNTGTYQDNTGVLRNITWNFSNADNTKLQIFFTNTPANFTVTWENIRSKNGKISLDEYFTDGNTGANSHGQFIRIPKP